MDRNLLIDDFRFDRWANEQWREALARLDPALVGPEALRRLVQPGPITIPQHGAPGERLGIVFAHTLWAHRIWLSRIGRDVTITDGDAGAWIAAFHEAWVSLLTERDLDEVIEYRNTQGREGRRTMAEIARHVADHDTYHRGQMREIYGSTGREDFPETGKVGYFMEA